MLWESRKITKGEGAGSWGLLRMRPEGGWAENDDGTRFTAATKKEAEAERREREGRVKPGGPKAKGDIFRDKALRKRLTGKRKRPIIEITQSRPKGD